MAVKFNPMDPIRQWWLQFGVRDPVISAEQDANYIQSLVSESGSRLREIAELTRENMRLRRELDVASYNWRMASVDNARMKGER